jgi:hypothetical protein
MNEYLAYGVMVAALALGYMAGRWHGAIHEREAFRSFLRREK